VLRDEPGLERTAVDLGKDESMLAPEHVSGLALQLLLHAVLTQAPCGVGVEGDPAYAALRLRPPEDQASTDVDELLDDGDGQAVGAHVVPAQPKCLAATEPGDDQQLVERRQAVTLDRLEKGAALLRRPRTRAHGVLAGELDVVGRVVGDQPALHGGVQG